MTVARITRPFPKNKHCKSSHIALSIRMHVSGIGEPAILWCCTFRKYRRICSCQSLQIILPGNISSGNNTHVFAFFQVISYNDSEPRLFPRKDKKTSAGLKPALRYILPAGIICAFVKRQKLKTDASRFYRKKRFASILAWAFYWKFWKRGLWRR